MFTADAQSNHRWCLTEPLMLWQGKADPNQRGIMAFFNSK